MAIPVYGCVLNILLIIMIHSVIRLLIYKQFSLLIEIDKRILSRAVLIIAFIIWMIIDVPNNYWKFKNQKFTEYVQFLSSTLKLSNNPGKMHVHEIVWISLLIVSSLANELYIGIKVKLLPWNKLKTVTIGHVFVAMLFYLTQIMNVDESFSSIRASVLCFFGQSLYLLRYRSFLCEIIYKLAPSNNVSPNTTSEENFNEFGIYVGNASHNNVGTTMNVAPVFNIEIEKKKIEKFDIDTFGGVYIGEDLRKEKDTETRELNVQSIMVVH